MRPRGIPPIPRAASTEREVVEMVGMLERTSLDPRRMMEPLPNCFSIWVSAISMARPLSFRSWGIASSFSEMGNTRTARLGRILGGGPHACQEAGQRQDAGHPD